jgi:hypothetical protein
MYRFGRTGFLANPRLPLPGTWLEIVFSGVSVTCDPSAGLIMAEIARFDKRLEKAIWIVLLAAKPPAEQSIINRFPLPSEGRGLGGWVANAGPPP